MPEMGPETWNVTRPQRHDPVTIAMLPEADCQPPPSPTKMGAESAPTQAATGDRRLLHSVSAAGGPKGTRQIGGIAQACWRLIIGVGLRSGYPPPVELAPDAAGGSRSNRPPETMWNPALR